MTAAAADAPDPTPSGPSDPPLSGPPNRLPTGPPDLPPSGPPNPPPSGPPTGQPRAPAGEPEGGAAATGAVTSGAVYVVGSINTDLVAYVERLPVGGETLFGERFAQFAGGKGANQAVAAARAGATTTFIGAVGDDAYGRAGRDSLEQAGVGVDGLATLPGHASGVALILVDRHGENQIVVAPGANLAFGPEIAPPPQAARGAPAPQGSSAAGADPAGGGGAPPAGLISGHPAPASAATAAATAPAPGVGRRPASPPILLLQNEIAPATTAACAKRWCAAGARVIWNLAPAPAAPPPPELLASVEFVLVNEVELAVLADGGEDRDGGAPDSAPDGGADSSAEGGAEGGAEADAGGISAAAVAAQLPAGPSTTADACAARALALVGGRGGGAPALGNLIVTLGAQGCIWAYRGAGGRPQLHRQPALPVTAVDTVGAGDCFCGVFAAVLAAGATPPTALKQASAAAALSVQREGAQPSLPHRAEIEAALSGHLSSASAS